MKDKLSNKDKRFVKELLETGNKTQSALKAYNYKNENTAGVMALEKLRNPKIQQAIQTIADSIPDDELIQVHKEGLKASRTIKRIDDKDIIEPDYAVRHKYLDSAYKIKGTYAPDKLAFTNKDGEDLVTKEQASELLALLNK
jgi:phage terminase small subunit